MEEALARLEGLRRRTAGVAVEGHRQFNPGWHLALDLRNMLLVSDCIARAALEREESRGGHTRDDFPKASAEWRRWNLLCSLGADGTVAVERRALPSMPPELLGLFERKELASYLTEEELGAVPDLVPGQSGGVGT
jgi:succinate dehydrogenase / fumarate reductase flavoprotein subunit